MSVTAISENRLQVVPNLEVATPRSPSVVLAPQFLQFRENEVIFQAGDAPQGLYLLRSGSVKLVSPRKRQRGRMNSADFITRILAPGELFGFGATIRHGAHLESARALKSVEVELIPATEIQNILQGPPSLLQSLLKQMMSEIEAATHREQLHYLASVQERIADQLLLLAEDFGVEVPEGIAISLRLTRNELAQLAGTINESLSRHLTEFRDEGILELRGKEIILKNREALLAKAGVQG